MTTTLDARVTAYCDGVLDGTIVVGRLVRRAVERHVRDIGNRRGLRFDVAAANFAIAFAECLHHSKGEWRGQPIRLEPWECFFLAALFGWQRADGTRRYRTAYVEVARKNGKSTLGAILGHKLTVADGEGGPEVYSAATKRDQAKIVHEEAKRMVRSSPALRRRITILRDNLIDEANDGKYQPLGADADTLDGLNVHGAIVDEVHAHKNRELWDVLDTATGARRQPLLIAITTAGDGNDTESICYELRDYSVKVLEDTIDDDSWFGLIYELDEATYDAEGNEVAPADDWTDEATWPKANPNLGVSVKLDDLRRKAKKAQETPAAAVNFRRKHLNQWIAASSDWLPAGLWDACRGGDWYTAKGIDPAKLAEWQGRACWIGGDLSSVADLTAVVAAIPRDDGTVDVLPLAWCPRDNAVGRQRDKRVPYVTWAERGQLELTAGNSVDYDFVRARIRWLRDDVGLDVQEVALDPHNARYLATKLAEEDGFAVFEHRQGYISMNDPIKQATKLLLDRRLRHGGHRPLAWCVSNVVTTTDAAGNIKFDKDKSKEKIDLAVALAMAVGRATAGAETASAYESRGVWTAQDLYAHEQESAYV